MAIRRTLILLSLLGIVLALVTMIIAYNQKQGTPITFDEIYNDEDVPESVMALTKKRKDGFDVINYDGNTYLHYRVSQASNHSIEFQQVLLHKNDTVSVRMFSGSNSPPGSTYDTGGWDMSVFVKLSKPLQDDTRVKLRRYNGYPDKQSHKETTIHDILIIN